MGATAKDFTLFKRGDVWYAQFRLPDGKRSTPKSTGHTAKSRAEQWARDYLKAGDVVESEKVRLKKFASDFYAWDSVYIRKKRLDNKSISQKWTEQKQGLTDRYIIPYFGNASLTQIDDNKTELFRQYLSYELKLAPQTVNHVLICFGEIMKQAKKLKLIQYIPEINKVKMEDSRPGVLTPDEVRALFFGSVEWGHPVAYLINLTMCMTGMRAGEAQAVQLKNVHPGYIEIAKTWDTEKLKLTDTTKNKKIRVVAISPKLQVLLQKLYDNNPQGTPDGFLFYADKAEDKPIDKKVMLKYFYRALEQIGITPEERQRRKIVAHSHRHFWNSFLLNSGVNKFAVQEVISHADDKMTEHYFHSALEDQRVIVDLQDGFFEG